MNGWANEVAKEMAMTFTYVDGPFDFDTRLEKRRGELILSSWGKVIGLLRKRIELKSQVEWVYEAGVVKKGEVLKEALPGLALATAFMPVVGALATAMTVKNALVDQVVFYCKLRDYSLFVAGADRKTFEQIRSYAKTDPPKPPEEK